MRILVTRPDHLGDVLLTSPALAALRAALPEAFVCVAVTPGLADVPAHFAGVDQSRGVPFPPITGPADPPMLARLASELGPSFSGFDVAILPRADDPWSGAVVAAAGIPHRVGYAHPRTRPFLTRALPFPPAGHVATHATALVAEALRCLSMAGPATVPCHAPFVTTAAEDAAAQACLDALAIDCPIVVHPGSGWRLKNWPARRWGEVAAALGRRFRTLPLVVGARSEASLAEEVVAASGGCARSIVGRLSVGELAALLRRARVLVATDSGPLHLAALVGTPVVGVYGPADPEEFGPLGQRTRWRIVHAELPCRPCRTMVDPPCGSVADPPCLLGVDAAMVLRAVDDLLAASQANRPLRRQ